MPQMGLLVDLLNELQTDCRLAPAKKPEDANAIAEEIIANAKRLCSQLFESNPRGVG